MQKDIIPAKGEGGRGPLAQFLQNTLFYPQKALVGQQWPMHSPLHAADSKIDGRKTAIF